MEPQAIPTGARLLSGALLALAGGLALLAALVPSGPMPPAWPMPDLLFCLVALWAVRRPDATAPLLVFALGLLGDFLLDRPVGLGALALLLTAEFMAAQGRALREGGFFIEWLVASVLFALLTAATVLLMWVALATLPRAGDMFALLGVTVLAYPAVFLAARGFLGLRARRTGGLAGGRA